MKIPARCPGRAAEWVCNRLPSTQPGGRLPLVGPTGEELGTFTCRDISNIMPGSAQRADGDWLALGELVAPAGASETDFWPVEDPFTNLSRGRLIDRTHLPLLVRDAA